MRDALSCWWIMRTTLELDEDVVLASKELARRRGVTFGQVVSELARASLIARSRPKTRNGVPLFEARKSRRRPDLHLVNKLRDEL